MIGDFFLLHRDQQDIELIGAGVLSQHLVIQVHICNIKRDVLLRLPADGFRQIFFALDGEGDLLHDHRVPRDRSGDTTVFYRLLGKDPVDGIGDRDFGDYHPIHDAFRGDLLNAKAHELETALAHRDAAVPP